MDIALVVNELVPKARYNIKAFEYSEFDARELKLWRDYRPMPTQQELEDKWLEMQPQLLLAEQEKAIRDEYAQRMQDVAKPYYPEERETWSIQREEALMYIADDTSEVPFITTMATARGITVLELANKIKENWDLYKIAIAQLLGEQQKQLDSLYGI